MRARIVHVIALAALAPIVVGCASKRDDAEMSAKAAAVMKTSFKERGQAKLDRLDQDDTQRSCTVAGVSGPPTEVASRIEKINFDAIKWPADGKLTGDWKNGEKIAQEGRGMQYSDDPKGPVGANCYACHQLSKQELSYGTIGPSLYQFGRQRGFTDDVRKYAYGKIYNAEAYHACTNMPRFGAKGILNEAQIKDLTALLMDPESPVNQ